MSLASRLYRSGARGASPFARRVAPRPRSNTSRLAPPPAGISVDSADASSSVVRYPSAIDSPPALGPSKTSALSGLYHNFLALLIEAVQAEIGPIDLDDGGKRDLLYWLGSEVTGNRVSNWKSEAKVAGGNAAGQIYGLRKRTVTAPATTLGFTPLSTSFSISQGIHPLAKQPILFATTSAFGHVLNSVFFVDGPATVRGGVTGSGGGLWTANYLATSGDVGAGLPVGATSFNVDLLLVHMAEAI